MYPTTYGAIPWAEDRSRPLHVSIYAGHYRWMTVDVFLSRVRYSGN
jgi:hypothetical protein